MSAIALGPPDPVDQPPTIPPPNEYVPPAAIRFVDEVYIEDQNVLTIPLEKMFEEQPRRARKSRWGEKPEKRPKTEVNYQFDPLEAMMNRKAIMPLNAGAQVATNSMNPLGFMIPGFSQFTQQNEERTHSRWGPEHEKTFQPPSLNGIPPGLSIDDFEYIIRLYCLDEVYQKLSKPIDLKNEDKDLRSPSPEQIYDAQGKRLNTREQRRKDQLYRTKISLIEECMKMRKSFVPPHDYRPLKKQRKIYLQESYYTPDVNYIGLIIGPKGQTQKMLESKTGCKISIRGKGASKTKRIELDSDDRLHVLIQAETDENLDQGVNMVEKILRGEDEDESKRNQRLQLQVVTGVLRDDFCQLCHEKGHRSWACPSKLAWTQADVKCEICGERSHPTSDCPRKGVNKEAYMTSEYNKMLSDMGQEGRKITLEQENTGMAKPVSVQDNLKFITNASFTGFNLQQQLAADPERMEELKREEEERRKFQQQQMNALQKYTLNNSSQFSVQQYAEKQMTQQNQQFSQMASQYPGMMFNPYSFYGGFGGNQLALGYGVPPPPMPPPTTYSQPYGYGYTPPVPSASTLTSSLLTSNPLSQYANLVPPPKPKPKFE